MGGQGMGWWVGSFTMAMQRARPTKMRPSRRPALSGRKAHASASW